MIGGQRQNRTADTGIFNSYGTQSDVVPRYFALSDRRSGLADGLA